MRNWKAFSKKLLTPPLWLTVLLAVFSILSLVLIFIKDWDTSPFGVAAYVIAFYTLTVICMRCYTVFPSWYRRIKAKVYENKYANRYLTDAAFKTHVTLYATLAVNLLYVGMNILSLILYKSAWFGILAGYYGILAVMRFLLARYVNRHEIGTHIMGELKRSRLCAMILMTLNLVLSGAVLMILYQNKGYEYHGMLIYVMAAYTFYITVNAIVSMVKYRKYNSPVMTTTKVISFSSALVSMLNLETAMLTQFGSDNSPEFRRIMIAATGAGVAVLVITMSVYIIIKTTKDIRKLKEF